MYLKSRVLFALILLALCFITTRGMALSDTARPHFGNQIDNKRFIYVEAWKTQKGFYIQVKLSNGWRVDPLHVVSTVILYQDHKELVRQTTHIWAPASGAGGATERIFGWDTPFGCAWPPATSIYVTATTEPPPGDPNGTPPPIPPADYQVHCP